MRLLLRLALLLVAVLALSLPTAPATATERVHVVAKGHTLGKIARRYHVSVAAICNANGIRKDAVIRPGQKLTIPDRDDEDGSRARAARARSKRPAPTKAPSGSGAQQLAVPGVGSVTYYEPVGPGRLTLRPVLFYLHGRGGHAQSECARWAPIARRLGWLVCPSGPEPYGSGRRWKTWMAGHRIVMKSLEALRKEYGRRVQLYGNTLIGFSEGAYVAMNIGVREPRAFNRWLILGADTDYWGPMGHQRLAQAKGRVRRVYFITGEHDGVIEETRQVREWLRRAGVPARITTPSDMGHELALERKTSLYRMALIWLDRGSTRSASVAKR